MRRPVLRRPRPVRCPPYVASDVMPVHPHAPGRPSKAMAWPGKILGGPLGALVGAALGRNLDRCARSERGWADPGLLDADCARL